MSRNKIKKFSTIFSIVLILCMVAQVVPLSVLGATVQEPITKDGTKYSAVTTRTGNSNANIGDKITANGAKYDITLDEWVVGSLVFNKNSPYIEITITNNVAVKITWNCGSKYANSTISVAGTYKIPQLLQDNGRTQSFDAIWVTEVRQISIFEDTDGDGLPDILEIKYGMDPNNPDTLGDGILDGDRIFTVTETSEDWNAGDVVKPILNIQLQGKYIASLTIDKVPDTDVFLCPLIPGYVGNAYDFNIECSFVSATLTFVFDSGLLNNPDFVPTIYYWNEEIQLLEELSDQTIIGNAVTASIEHFSSYILLNKVPFDKVWENEIKPPNYGGGGEAKPLDIVFSIDSTGSMATNDPRGIRRDAAKNFVDKLGDNDRAAVVAFMTYAYLRAGFTSDKTELYRAIDTIDNSGSSTSNYRGLELALAQFDENSRDAHRYIIILTDGQDNDGPTNYALLINEAIAKDVIIFTIGLGSSVNTGMLRNVAESTGGKYYHATTAGELLKIFEDIAEENIQTDTDNDGLPDYFEKLINDGTLRGGSGVALRDYPNAVELSVDNPYNKDSDGDGLMDGEEVIIRTQLNPDGITCKVWVYMFSNPCTVDTDGDHLPDDVDPEPLKHFYDYVPKFNSVAYNQKTVLHPIKL
jgi:Mg-chelatase subunit ChlD